MDRNLLLNLLQKYEAGICTDEEKKIVEEWYDSYDENPTDHKTETELTERFQLLYEDLNNRLEHESGWPRKNHGKIVQLFANFGKVATVVVILCSIVIFFWVRSSSKETVLPSNAVAKVAHDLEPGTNRAILTLGDGTQVNLDNAHNGKLAEQGNATIVKLNTGRLTYQQNENLSGQVVYNKISTPRGGQYEIVLPDGTTVWLNAASTLRFPSVFNDSSRHVELVGEAYFEVSKMKRHLANDRDEKVPFFVDLLKPGGPPTNVEVLGTHFNIMAYPDENEIKTTLVEGAVRMNVSQNHLLLKPGEQASLSAQSGALTSTVVDVDEQLAWRNQLFWFKNTDVKKVMRQISRWYDVDVEYQPGLHKEFSGTLPRTMMASKVFDVLELTGGVHFKIDGKKVIVMP